MNSGGTTFSSFTSQKQKALCGVTENYSLFTIHYSLNLDEQEEKIFQQKFAKIEPRRRKQTMEIITSYERRGIEKGIKIGKQEGIKIGEERGKQQEAAALISRQLTRRLGAISALCKNKLKNYRLQNYTNSRNKSCIKDDKTSLSPNLPEG